MTKVKKITRTLVKELESLVTRDYQNRDGNYPKSNVPDTINKYDYNDGFGLVFSFKSTSEQDALKWVERKLRNYSDYILKINASQTGGYDDDWVEVDVQFEKRKSSKAS